MLHEMTCAAITTIREALESGCDYCGGQKKKKGALVALASLEKLVQAAQNVEQTSDSFRNGKGAEWADVDDARRRYSAALAAAVGPGEEPVQ